MIALTALAMAGCSVGTQAEPDDDQTRILGRRVDVIVTTDGGATLVTRRSVPIERDATALSALTQVADVRRDPRGTVAQVNGRGGGALSTFGPDPSTWRYRIDGIESSVRPDRFRLRPGMSVWWDLRRVDIYERLPVAVGVFPEPLFSGWRDSARGLRIAYAPGFSDDAEFLRRTVFEQLEPDVVALKGDEGFGGTGIGDGESGGELVGAGEGEGAGDAGDGGDEPRPTVAVRTDRANLVIGRWEQVRLDPYVADIGLDPRAFGLVAFVEGTNIVRQEPAEEFTRELVRAEGLVWASTVDGEADSAIVYVVTGTTDEGVRGAARALRSGECQFYIACAVDREGVVIR